MALTQEKLTRIIARRIARSMKIDQDAAMAVADEIREDINLAMDVADEGDGIRPISQGREPEIPAAPPPPANIMAPVHPEPVADPTKKILMPGDPGFNKPNGLKDGKVRAFPLKRVSPTASPIKTPPRKWWSSETLTQALNENTPPTIEFTPEESKNVITAVRNILNQEGFDCVYLEYAHPDASRELGFAGRDNATMTPTGAPNLPAVARVCFTLYDKELDIPKSMESMMKQLRGMYRPRPQTLVPSMPPDRPLRVADAAPENTAQEDTGLVSGWSSLGPRVSLGSPITLADGNVITEVADATSYVRDRVKQENLNRSPQIPRR